MSKWLDKFRQDGVFNIGFVPESPEEQYEAAKIKVANMLDEEEWKWVKARIADESLSWPQIFDLVAANL